MQVKLEKIEKNKVALEIEVAVAKFEEALEKAYKKVATKVNIPGFRKGKAPRAMIERHYGPDVLYNDALDEILPDSYLQAIDNHQVQAVDKPEIDLIQVEAGKPLIYKAIVTVKPEFELGDYKGIDVVVNKPEVTDEDIQFKLEELQRVHAKVATLEEGTIQQGDTVIFDFEGSMDGEVIPQACANDYSLEIGSGTFVPGFEDQMVGIAIGEEKVITVKFPEDYHAENMAGKDVEFKVKVNEIKRKELTPLDDEFAKDVSEFETLEELKADFRNKLEEAAEVKALDDAKNSILNAVAEKTEIEIPEAMIQTRLDGMIKDFEMRLRYQGLDLNGYLAYTGQTPDQLRESYRVQAEKAVKMDLILEAIAAKEAITPSEDDVQEALAKLAKQNKREPKEIEQFLISQGNMDIFKNDLKMEKTIDFLLEINKKAS